MIRFDKTFLFCTFSYAITFSYYISLYGDSDMIEINFIYKQFSYKKAKGTNQLVINVCSRHHGTSLTEKNVLDAK